MINYLCCSKCLNTNYSYCTLVLCCWWGAEGWFTLGAIEARTTTGHIVKKGTMWHRWKIIPHHPLNYVVCMVL